MQPSPWLIRTKAQPYKRLFCFPYAGGGASIYRQWARTLPDTIEVCAVQLPARENRIMEPAFTQLTPLLQTLTEVLQPHLDRPFCFFGHSMGALISFELARYLRKQGLPQPERLLLSAHRAPQLPHNNKPIHDLPDKEFIDAIQKLGGTPEAVLQHAELMQMLLPTLRADFTIYETYHYQAEPALPCPFTILGGTQDQEVAVAELEAWHSQTRGDFQLHLFSGGHFYIHSHQEQLLRTIAAYL